jgi:protein SCO1/2
MNRTRQYIIVSCLVALGCRGQGAEGTPDSPTGVPTASGTHATLPVQTGEASLARDTSIYALSMNLTDQNGQKVGLDVDRGKPVLLAMFYGSCPSACPLLISTAKRVMAGLDGGAASDVRVLLVSFDPQRDTPDALRRIAAERGLDDVRWRLASAPDEQVRDLAALLGVQYRRLPDGNFNHTSSIVLLDRSGRIAARLDDMVQAVEPLVQRAESL